MAPRAQPRKRTPRAKYAAIKRLAAGVALLAYGVILAAGLRADVSLMTITWRAMLATGAIGVVSVVVVRVLGAYEEMNRGKS